MRRNPQFDSCVYSAAHATAFGVLQMVSHPTTNQSQHCFSSRYSSVGASFETINEEEEIKMPPNSGSEISSEEDERPGANKYNLRNIGRDWKLKREAKNRSRGRRRKIPKVIVTPPTP